MNNEPAFGLLPQSSALAEASPESLNELLACAPEELTQEKLRKIVGALRAQRERWMRAETLKREAPRAKGAKPLSKPLAALLEARPPEVSSDDLGL